MVKKSIVNIGDKFNNLTILEILPSRRYGKNMKRIVLCKCECGNEKEIQLGAITTGHTKSCGKCDLCKHVTHGLMRKGITSGLGFVWNGIQRRIYNINSKEYKHYGGRGIKCEWGNIYEFLKDMQSTYRKGLSIERIDVNGNYSKENCKWITNKEQQRNRTNTVWIEHNGENRCLSEWCEILGLKRRTVSRRLELGWDKIDALTIPVTSKTFRYKSLTTK